MNYTETDLDRIESESGEKVRPREREAGRNYLLMPEGERSYSAVAKTLIKSDGTNPTDARTAVYVREYLNTFGLLEEAPRPGRRSANGGNGPTTQGVRNMPQFADVIQNAIDQYKAEISRVQELFADAAEEVANFDADAYKATVQKEFEDKIAELNARLTAWVNDDGNVASDSATKTLNDLTRRKDSLENEASGEKITFLTAQAEMAESQLAAMIEAQRVFEAATGTGPDSPPSEDAE